MFKIRTKITCNIAIGNKMSLFVQKNHVFLRVQERSNVMYFQSYSHPALVKRIFDSGKPQDVAKKQQKPMKNS